MLDIKFVKENPEIVKENIKKKFEDAKLPLVDEAISLYDEKKDTNSKASELRANRNKYSKQIGALMGQGKLDEAEDVKKLVNAQADELKALEAKENDLEARLKEVMMKIPNIVDPKTMRKMLRFSSSVSRRRSILKFLIIPILWRNSTASIKKPQAGLPARAFIILWAISQGFTAPLPLMPVIL